MAEIFVLIVAPKADSGSCMSMRLMSWLNLFNKMLESVDSKNDIGAANADLTKILWSLMPEVGPIIIKNWNSIPPMDSTLTVDTKKYIPIKSGILGVADPVFHWSQSSTGVNSSRQTGSPRTRKIRSEDRNQNEDQSDQHGQSAN
jgi:hypothetical protein